MTFRRLNSKQVAPQLRGSRHPSPKTQKPRLNSQPRPPKITSPGPFPGPKPKSHKSRPVSRPKPRFDPPCTPRPNPKSQSPFPSCPPLQRKRRSRREPGKRRKGGRDLEVRSSRTKPYANHLKAPLNPSPNPASDRRC